MPSRKRVPRAKKPRPVSPRALRERVAELEETLRAIRAGEVDALVVDRGGEHKVFTLEGADSAFRKVVEQMSEGALTIRPDGTILYCNQRFADLVGEPMERVLGTQLTRFASEASRPALQALIAQARDGLARGEVALSLKTRREIPALVSLSHLKDYAVPALCVSVADLTSQKREVELAAFAEKLERSVTARTAELSLANRELEAFCYSASHDLRGPLRTISSFSDLLTRRLGPRLDKEEADFLRFIGEGVNRMSSIIDSLLSLSRATKGELARVEVDLSEAAAQVGAELAAAAPARAVALQIQPGLRAKGDPRLLRQVLHNLLGNAWKFTSKKEGARVSLERVREGGVEAFRVEDNGIGFDMAYVEKIFQPFQRLHTREVFEGSGIGLALVQRIVERHGGKLWARGEVGRGAAFFFTLGEGRDADA